MSSSPWKLLLLPVTLLALSGHDLAGQEAIDPQIGKSFRVPYRLTDTNHFLVRVRVNGKGPFNMLVDSGAPALYIATETARKIGLKPTAGEFFTPVEALDFEGGARLTRVKARVEDPFQLVGMNALGLPGASIDGILGFTILARYRLEIDPTKDRMTWTRLGFVPRDPPVPRPQDGQAPPADFQAMNALGPLAKGLAFLMGKQPEDVRHPRGFLGITWVAPGPGAGGAAGGESGAGIRIARVFDGSPAAKAGVEAGDLLLRARGRPVGGAAALLAALAAVRPGDSVELVVRRPGAGDDRHSRELTLTVTAGEGL